MSDQPLPPRDAVSVSVTLSHLPRDREDRVPFAAREPYARHKWDSVAKGMMISEGKAARGCSACALGSTRPEDRDEAVTEATGPLQTCMRQRMRTVTRIQLFRAREAFFQLKNSCLAITSPFWPLSGFIGFAPHGAKTVASLAASLQHGTSCGSFHLGLFHFLSGGSY